MKKLRIIGFILIFSGVLTWSFIAGVQSATAATEKLVWSERAMIESGTKAVIAVDSKGKIHMVWADNRAGDRVPELYYTKLESTFRLTSNGNFVTEFRKVTEYNEDGTQIILPIKLTKLSGSIDSSVDSADINMKPWIVIDSPEFGENIHIAWWNHTSQYGTEIITNPENGKVFNVYKNEVYYMKLNNKGIKQTLAYGENGEEIKIKQITNYDAKSNKAAFIDVDSVGNVHILWRTCLAAYDNPEILGDCGKNEPFWRGARYGDGYNLYYTKLDNGGNPLLEPDLNNPDLINRYNKKLTAVDQLCCGRVRADKDGHVHIIYDRKNAAGNLELYYMRLDGTGKADIHESSIAGSETRYSCCANLSIDSDNELQMTWFDGDSIFSADVYYTKLDNSGNRLITDDICLTNDLSPATTNTQDPMNAIDPYGNLHVSMWDGGWFGNTILYRKLDNNGNFLTDLTVIRGTGAGNARPAADSWGNAYVTDYARGIHIKRSYVSPVIIEPLKEVINNSTPALKVAVDVTENEPQRADISYSWDGGGEITGCRDCISYSTTYGENDGSDADIVGLWHFNENSGTTAYDDSENKVDNLGNIIKINGTLSTPAQPPSAPSNFGYALDFSGSDSYVQVEDNEYIDFNATEDSFAIMAWINSSVATTTAQYIVNKQTGLSTAGYHLFLTKSGNLRFMIHTPSGEVDIAGTNNLFDGNWHHVAGTYDAQAGMAIYVDGERVGVTSDTAPASSLNNASLFIGAYGTNASERYFNGSIDEVAIYRRPLTWDEIRDMYNKTLPDGPHNVTVTAEDLVAGNTQSTAWFVLNKYTISLNSGWNLISIPLEQDDWSIESVLQSLEYPDGSKKYERVYAYIDGVWVMSTSRSNPLTEMSLEYGYWIEMKEPAVLELTSGRVPSVTTIKINPEENYVGYPSFTTRNITDLLSSIAYERVYAYIDGDWVMSTSRNNPLTEMTHGLGYWIKTPVESNITSYDVSN